MYNAPPVLVPRDRSESWWSEMCITCEIRRQLAGPNGRLHANPTLPVATGFLHQQSAD